MNLENELRERSGSVCELCGGTNALQVYPVPPASVEVDKNILLCKTCLDQVQDFSKLDANHFRCLNNTMWSTVPGVQVMAWRILYALRSEGCAVEAEIQESEFGKFGWVIDPEGNKIELWEPPEGQ